MALTTDIIHGLGPSNEVRPTLQPKKANYKAKLHKTLLCD